MSEDDYKFPYLPSAAAEAEQYLSGMATPPLHALASVPFKWEEQPGKPRPCTDIIVRPEPAKCLELPPCRGRMTKMPSPTTVLDGPYNLGRPRFSSFRLFREKQSSFDSSSSGGGCSPESDIRYGDVVAGKKSNGRRRMNRLFSRSLRARRRGGKEGDHEGSFGFSPASFAGFDSAFVEEKKMRRNESSSVWVSMYESLKKAMPWKRTRKANTPK